MVWEGSEILGTGLTLLKVWEGKKWVITKEKSQWLLPDNSGYIKGVYYGAYDKTDIDNVEMIKKVKRLVGV